jgi:hypothetical protein
MEKEESKSSIGEKSALKRLALGARLRVALLQKMVKRKKANEG